MLRFIFLVTLIIVLMRVAQDNPYIGFSLYLFMAVAFVIYSNNTAECENIKYERELLKTPEGRRKYYQIVNSR